MTIGWGLIIACSLAWRPRRRQLGMGHFRSGPPYMIVPLGHRGRAGHSTRYSVHRSHPSPNLAQRLAPRVRTDENMSILDLNGSRSRRNVYACRDDGSGLLKHRLERCQQLRVRNVAPCLRPRLARASRSIGIRHTALLGPHLAVDLQHARLRAQDKPASRCGPEVRRYGRFGWGEG